MIPVRNSKSLINSQHSVPYDLQLEILMLGFFLHIYGTLKAKPTLRRVRLAEETFSTNVLRGCPNQHRTLPCEVLVTKIFVISPIQPFCKFQS